MKVLLIKSSNLTARSKGATPPLGLMYIASYIRQRRHDEVKIIDTRLYKEPLKEVYNTILKFQPDIVGIGALTFEAPSLYHIAHVVKQVGDIPVVAGGPHATSVPREILNNQDINVVVIGEGEITFKELLDAWERGNDLHSIDGIAYRDHDDIKINKPRAYIDNLDNVPFPAWDLAELKKYINIYSINGIRFHPYMVLQTSRGCPFRCTYCHNIFGKKFRARSAENVLAEMDTLINTYGISDFIFLDDIPNLEKERIKAILRGMITRGWKTRLYFTNGVRADMLDDEIVHLMKKAGTVEIAVAVETVSPRLQKMVKKNLNLEKVARMIDVCVDQGMFVTGFFMLGFPTETEAELRATVNFACNSRLHQALFFLVNPFGDTELARQIESTGKMTTHLKPEDFDYHSIPFNASSMPDKTLHRIYSMAWIRFYMNPVRIVRILKARKLWLDLPYMFGLLIKDIFAGKGNKRVRFETIDIEFFKKNKKTHILNSLDNAQDKERTLKSLPPLGEDRR